MINCDYIDYVMITKFLWIYNVTQTPQNPQNNGMRRIKYRTEMI